MIKFNNEPFVEKVEKHPESKSRLAAKADSSEWVLGKVLQGQTDLNLSSIEKLADYVGLDVEINFVEKIETVAVPA